MKVWAIANQKGGVGKTTTTASLAAELAGAGLKVVALDLDPHGSLTHYFRRNPEAEGPGLADLFDGQAQSLAALAQPTEWAGVQLIAGGPKLATLDRQNRTGLGRVLLQAIKDFNQADVLLLDCPPTLGVLTVNALAACDLLLIPTQTEYLALKGLESMLRTRSMVEHARGAPLDYRIVPTLYDRRTRAGQQALADMQRLYTNRVWPEAIPVDTRFREAAALGVPVAHFGTDERGASAYHRLVDWLLSGASTPPVGSMGEAA